MHLAEKPGYREESRFRNAWVANGIYYGGMGYGVLREEWKQGYPAGCAASFHCPQIPYHPWGG